MTYTAISPYLISAISYLFGTYMMYRIMKPKLSKALFQYESMREAFQHKHATNQQLFESQRQLWKAYEKLLNYKLNNQ